jgi:hypothetical protein
VKAWVYVEGPSDCSALEALWSDWRGRLRQAGHGISIVPLDGKAKFLKKIGHRAAEKLAGQTDDLVVALPDLYPTAEYETTPFRHQNVEQLRDVQRLRVRQALVESQGLTSSDARQMMTRFFPTALKHDLEMLLLAAGARLGAYMRARRGIDCWRHPVEEQDQDRPPKTIVERLFHENMRVSYRDTLHAPAVLRTVANVREILVSTHGQIECPVFKKMLDWMGERMGVPAYL